MTWLLPMQLELELIQQEQQRRQRFSAWVSGIAAQRPQRTSQGRTLSNVPGQSDVPPIVRTVSNWGKAAPWVPRTVYMPLARQGVDPESDLGTHVVKHSAGFAKYRGQGPVTVNAAGHHGPLTARADIQPAPEGVVEYSGLGDVGKALAPIGQGIKAGAEAVQSILPGGSRDSFRKYGGERMSEQAHIPTVSNDLKSASRVATAALQAPYEAAATALTYRSPYAPPLPIGEQPYQRGTENPFSWKQLTLAHVFEDSGKGLLVSGPAAEAAREEQAKVRGTIGGHVLNPGRLVASQIVEPNTKPFEITSGLVDLFLATKTDPAAVALTAIGDIRQARKVFDTYGAYTNGYRNFFHGPTRDAWLASKKAEPMLDSIARNSSFRDIWRSTGKKLPVEVAAELSDARTVPEVKAILYDHLGSDVPTVPTWGYGISNQFKDVRWANAMSRGTVSKDNLGNAVEQMERTLVIGKADPKIIDRVLKEVATSGGDQTAFYKAVVKGGGHALAGTLEHDFGVQPDVAGEVSTFFQRQVDTDRLYMVDGMGNTPHATGITLDGLDTEIGGPLFPSQILNSEIPLPDARELRRTASAMKPLLDLPGVKGSHAVMDFITQGIFKPFALARFAWPVRVIAEEQVRMAAAGLDSMFHHPISHIARVVGKKEMNDALDIPFDQQAGSALDEVRSGMHFGTTAGSFADLSKGYSNHRVTLRPGQKSFTRGWADRLSFLHIDPVLRATAKAGRAGDLQLVKDSLWDGALKVEREKMIKTGGVMENLTRREASDAYVDEIVWPEIENMTAGHGELLDAVVDGSMRDQMQLSKRFVRSLDAHVQAGETPKVVISRAQLAGEARVSGAEAAGAKWSDAVDRMFSFLMSKPTNYLSRSPAFKQYYWQNMGDIFGRLDSEAQRNVLRVARNSKVDAKVIQKMRMARGGGDLALEHADIYAKGFAIDATKKLLYDTTKRNNFFDASRVVFPFGEAWKEVISVWAKLAVEQPQVVRRTQQVVQEARSSGFFYKDRNGDEVYNLPFSAGVNKFVTGVAWPMTSRVSGTNIVGQGLPGVGPVIQVGAEHVIPNNKTWDAVRDAIIPFGAPDVESGAWEALFPGWAQKLRTEGGIAIPGTKLKVPFFGPSENQKRIYQGTWDDVMASLYATHAFDLKDPEDMAKLISISKRKTDQLYTLRALAQSFSPSAPSWTPKLKAKDGKMYELRRLADDLRALEDRGDKEGFNGVQRFIDTYGEKAFPGATSHTQSQVYGGATTKQGEWWRTDNQDFVNTYPEVAGLFGPSTGDFDYNAYLRALDRGDLKPLTAREWEKAANYRVAASIYSQARDKIGPHPDKEQRTALSELNNALQDEYEGYIPGGSSIGKAITPKAARSQLLKAANSHQMKNTDLAKVIRLYFAKRQEQADLLKESGIGTFNNQSALPAREFMREIGGALTEIEPKFKQVWDQLLYGEFRVEDDKVPQ